MTLILLVDPGKPKTRQLMQRLSALGHEVTESIEDRDAIAAALTRHPIQLIVYVAAPRQLARADSMDALLPARGKCPVLIIAETGKESWSGEAWMTFLAAPFSDRELRLSLDVSLCTHSAAQSTRELSSFFSIAIDMFCFLDFNGYFKRLNPAWERVLGYSVEELMSRPFIEFVHPEDRDKTLAQNAAVRAGGEASGFENRYLHKDGTHRWLRWNARPQTVAGMIYSVARDITLRKQIEDERAALICTLEASLAEVNSLRDIIPICMYCRNVRDDKDYWQSVESYVSEHTATQFSHGICPSCMETEVEPQLRELNRD